MDNYLKTKVGKKVFVSFTTGETFYTEVYKRNFAIEIIKVTSNKITVKVTSKDITPSGMGRGGSDKSFPSFDYQYLKSVSIDNLLDGIARKSNPEFFNKYKFTNQS
jgi:hypothetical protein